MSACFLKKRLSEVFAEVACMLLFGQSYLSAKDAADLDYGRFWGCMDEAFRRDMEKIIDFPLCFPLEGAACFDSDNAEVINFAAARKRLRTPFVRPVVS